MAVAAQTLEVPVPLTADLQDAIAAFVTVQPTCHYRQLPEWIPAGDLIRPRVFVTRSIDGRLLASSILSELRRRWPVAPVAEIIRGPVAADEESLHAHLIAVVRLLGRRYSSLRVNPFVSGAALPAVRDTLLAAGFAPLSGGRFYSDTVVATVRPTPEEQWRALRGSTRTAINRGRRLGLVVSVERSRDAYAAFARNFSAFAATRGLPAFSGSMAAGIHAAFAAQEPPAALLLTASLPGETVGQALFMRNGSTLVYEWGWTAPAAERRKLPVTHGLLWHALGWSREHGCTALDLGGYWAARPATDPLNQFKRGFSKSVTPYCGVFERVCSPTAHFLRALGSRIRSSVTRARADTTRARPQWRRCRRSACERAPAE